MNTSFLPKFVVAIGCLAFSASTLCAQLATDNFETGTFPSSGTGAWTDAWTSTGAGGQFVGDEIDGNVSMGRFSGGASTRHFTPITSGPVTISWSMKSLVDVVAQDSEFGFQVLKAADDIVITLKFDGPSSSLILNDGGSDFAVSGITFTDDATYDFTLSLNPANNSYSFTASERGSAEVATGTGFSLTSGAPGSLTGIRFYANNLPAGGGNDVHLDNVVIPEPTATALIGSSVLGSLVLLRRRRR